VSQRLLVATSNAHKVAELRLLLPQFTVEGFVAMDQPPEDGRTYLENARIKARHARVHAPVDAWVAGEDSGIEAAALDGRPGVASARWADDGVAALLEALEGATDRRVRYVSELVVIAPDGEELRGSGTLAGTVTDSPRGSEGFGYDPIVVPLGETNTVAELGDAWKSEHSHRALAVQALTGRIATRAR
jgi:XTP/dITP diphosphohydrolase